MGIVRLSLRHGRSGGIESDEIAYDDIDLDQLTARARTLAEAIAERPERNRGAIAVHNGTERIMWENWSRYPVDSPMDAHTYLEQQAARFPTGWTVVGSREHPATSISAQEREWVATQCAEAWGVKPATWRAYVSRGQAPQPFRRVGATPVWDPAEVSSWPRPGQGARSDLPRPSL